jgi:DNA polymerase/3'-5' exonuclease PolX
MRKRALDLGYSLNEHSLTNTNTGEDLDIFFDSEKAIFEFLKMKYVEPQNR